MKISKYYYLVGVVIIFEVLTLIYFGQPIISKTGNVWLWGGGPEIENSQQIFDWYSPSHIIHGILFFFGLAFLFKKFGFTPTSSLTKFGANTGGKELEKVMPLGQDWVGPVLLASVILESAWEILENSPLIINRYRETAIAAGYFGDSVLNSFFDVICMIIGFYFAKRVGWKISLAVIIFFELLTLYIIRDNLTLNIVTLIHPIEAINSWQTFK